MKQNTPDTLDLILRHTGGDGTPEMAAELSRRLRDDTEARAEVCDLALEALAIAEQSTAVVPLGVGAPVTVGAMRNDGWRQRWLPLAAALALMAGLSALFSPLWSAPEVVRVVSLQGPARWTGDGGRVVALESNGVSLRGGTVRTLSDGASVTLRFDDGSEITLAGESEVTVSEVKGRKHVFLNEGDLSASIEKQHPERPFVIHTATAELEVLGTRFEVQSAPDATVLTVSEGAVRVTRRVDGSTVDVPADHQVRASLRRSDKLQPVERKAPLHSWTSDLSVGPGNSGGRWLPPSGDRGARLAAEPVLLPKDRSRDEPVTIHSVKFRVPPRNGSHLELTPGSVLRFRGHLEQSQSFEIMLSLTHRRGGFAGNYFFRTETLPAGPWEIEVSAAQFGRWDYRAESVLPKFPQLRQIVLYTIDADAGLEVESVTVQPE